jgi:hypothetical protein
MQTAAEAVHGRRFCIYGDPAYPHSALIQVGFAGIDLTPEQRDYNKRMSAVRVSVEWVFGKITNYWGFLDHKRNLKVFLQPVAMMYLVGGILTNCHTCVYGGLTGAFFDCTPPTLEDYLQEE